MLRIREDQVAILDRLTGERFLEEASDILVGAFPDLAATYQPTQLRILIQNAMKRGRFYGAESRIDIVRFAALSLLAGPRFDAIPEVNLFLIGHTCPVGEKLDHLLTELSSTLRHGQNSIE